MEDGDNGEARITYPNIGLYQRQLRFCTYDARDVMQSAQLQGISVYCQAILMSWCFNFSTHRVGEVIKGVRKENPTSSADEVVLKAREDRMGKPSHQATFTEKAMRNLYLLDKWILGADYKVDVEELANVLDKVSIEMLMDMRDEGRTHVGMAMVRLQETVARKNDTRESMCRFEAYQLQPSKPMSEEDRKRLEVTLEELRMVRKKEEENG